ncbi:hypothetical protein RRG08_006617 [Elysia crispata]|uniref:Coiled-coil domain-containing protein 135 n=1 Tax=Elysia crispata TaxID=231223 RepID=A0AAE1D6B0_9GAST|nr:hypothetical protein RRG08_006617 [Elysia crispata]
MADAEDETPNMILTEVEKTELSTTANSGQFDPEKTPSPKSVSKLNSAKEFVNSVVEEIQNISIGEIIKPVEEVIDPEKYPQSYKDNSDKEKKALKYCKTFIKQYNFLFDRRRPLFLKPKNVLGVKKLVCTTIKPGQLPYKELLDWPGIADFVAGYVDYDVLTPPHMLPEVLQAPQTTLERLHGHCFDMSTLLCSMLIGAGYDAFVVSGYATREVCLRDLSYTKCPFVEEDKKVYLPPRERKICRYTPRAPRLFRSEYELRMRLLRLQKQAKIENAEKAERDLAQQLREAPPADDLRGWRIHSWVIVLAGLRGVTDTFFIEPTTGTAHPTNWDQYLGIESIWNHKNYYINVQYLTIGENQKYKFEIGNTSYWEYIFPGQDLHDPPQSPSVIPNTDFRRLLQSMVDNIAEEKHFDLPFSWSLPLKVNRYDYDRRYPTGKRVRRYKYTIVEDFCRYLNPDGMVRRVTVHHDLKCENIWYIRETFEDREDLMESKFFHDETCTMVETFKIGREDFVREHRYHAQNMGPEHWHVIVYEPGKRTDELCKREAGKTFLKNHYQDRSDKKKFTGFTFGPRGKITERLALPSSRPIEEIVEEFDRDPQKPAAEDVAMVTFSTWNDEISLQYHTPENRFYGSTRDFVKPQNWWDDTQVLRWTPDLHSNFELDQFAKPKSELQLYQQLLSLMNIEDQLRNSCRLMEKEVGKFLLLRAKEKTKENQLVKSFLQADEDESIKADRLREKAQRRAEALLRKSDVLKDYLEPIICSLGLDKVTNKKQALRVKDDCMLALKERLITQAGYIKDHFEKERDIIDNAQLMYTSNFSSMTAQDIQDFRDFMVKHMFTAHILEQRLAHLKTHALILYQELFDKLGQDPRLEPFLI